MSESNGLLLLWNAAVELEGSEIEQMILQARTRRNNTLKLLKSQDSSFHNGKKSQIPVRHSHNELEKCRRAHLRSCMEKLKKVLRFDQDSVPCRITMLNVLKKAYTTINTRERSIHSMNIKETMAKNRFVELTNRLTNLQRQYKRLKNMQALSIVESAKAERMRNYSECSVLTTSSDDSNCDGARSRRVSSNYSKFYDQVSPVHNYKDKELSKYYKMSANQDDSMSGNHVYKCSSPNSNSCDSGFEESHINNINNNKGQMKSLQPSFVNVGNGNMSASKFVHHDPVSTVESDHIELSA